MIEEFGMDDWGDAGLFFLPHSDPSFYPTPNPSPSGEGSRWSVVIVSVKKLGLAYVFFLSEM